MIPKEPIILPSYKGSTLRGGFGNAFRRVVCALKKNDCGDCILKEKCVYSYVFETPPPSDTKIMRKYKSAPHPFIIEPPPEKRRGYTTENEITFGLTLIGRAIDYLPYFIYTFDELGKIGIGKGRGTYELNRVMSYESRVKNEENSERVIPAPDYDIRRQGPAGIQDSNSNIIYDSDTKTLKPFEMSHLSLAFNSEPITHNSSLLTLSFQTPARIIYDSHLTLDLEFHMLIRQLLRRMSLLAYFHCGLDASDWDFRGIIEKAGEVKVKESKLRWYEWERYSARQDTRLNMGGFVGEISFEGEIGAFMPLIKAGEVLHVGKGTSFGLGRFKIQDSRFKI
ncbi:MAG: CRISPR system precrRNA processing endoribonuclease RAMP protein Cas6 [Planctomycetes bacterium]|nr:CRISPR system precrRNA processing endoribonuclease RAMP protein Cas6 [Planctomycetota bacterium]